MEAPRKRSLSSEDTSDSKRAHSAESPAAATSDSEVSRGLEGTSLEDGQSQEMQEPEPPAYDDEPSRPAPSEQLQVIKGLRADPLVAGATWYIISRAWYRRFETMCLGLGSKEDVVLEEKDVGPVNNADITDGVSLKMHVVDGGNAVIVPKEGWKLLEEWYGNSGVEFARLVIGGFGAERVEFYPPTFYLVKVLPSDTSISVPIPVDHETPPSLSLSSESTLKDLKTRASYIFEGNDRPVRLWRLPRSPEPTLTEAEKSGPSFMHSDALSTEGTELIETELINDDSTLSEALLDTLENLIAVEEQLPTGDWMAENVGMSSSIISEPSVEAGAVKKPTPMFGNNPFFGTMGAKTVKRAPLTTVAVPGKSFFGAMTRSRAPPQKGQPGLVGLMNLGNTCFMNSALQCMSNTKELQEYFSAGVHKTELNRDNPLGMGGQVAEAFAQLIERIWSGNGGSVAPREFKQALSKFAPSFSGYGQQDSQELLAFLLDGIHEDLNRIKKKPGTNSPDWTGGGDKELVEMARICWEQYRSRNDSVIVDLFQGQYRSTVVCPDCNKVSITFDPFMYVTTNLPVTKKWLGKVYYVPLDPTRPRYSIELQLPKSATFKQLKVALGQLMNSDPKTLLAAEEWKGVFFKAWYDEELVVEADTPKDVIVFFETAAPYPQLQPRSYGKTRPAPRVKSPEEEALIVVSVQHEIPKKSLGILKTFGTRRPEHFGSPLLLTLTQDEASTYDGIYRALVRQYARVSSRGEEMLALLDEEEDSTPLESFVDPSLLNEQPPVVDDDEVVDIVVDAPITQDSMDVDSEPPTASTSALPTPVPTPSLLPTPGASPEPLLEPTAPPSTAKRSRALFKIKVSRATAAEIPLGQNDFNGPTVPLEARARRASSVDSDIFPSATQTTLPGSFVPSVVEGKRSADIPVDESNGAPVVAMEEIEPTGPTPIVGIGDFLDVEWSAAAFERFFGENGQHGTWSEVVIFVDPALEEASNSKGIKKVITIEDCLAEFTKEERLGEDDTWYCPDCKKHQQATKTVEIWKVPDVLVFALKRFSSSRSARDKIDDFVDFPVDSFDLAPYVEGDKVERRLAIAAAEESGVEAGEPDSLIYDLYAVDNHYGGLGGGHYTAYAKNHETGKWYDFDDSRVSELPDPDSVKTKAAYLLFYRRRTTRPIGAKTRELVESALQSRATSLANSEGVPSLPTSREHSPPNFSPPSPPAEEGYDGMDTLRSRSMGINTFRGYSPPDRYGGSPPNPYFRNGMASWNERSGSDTEAEPGTPPLLDYTEQDSDLRSTYDRTPAPVQEEPIVKEELFFDDSLIGKGSEMDFVE